MFKVEIRKDCKVCHALITGKLFRSYCSAKCRNKFFNTKYAGAQAIHQRKRQDREASKPSSKKIQCLVCKRYYVQIGSHVIQRHSDMFETARQYKEYFDLEVKKGVVPAWYKEMKGDQALDNGTFNNLKKGAKYRFKKGSKVAGRYHRSHVTIERLKKLHTLTKKNK